MDIFKKVKTNVDSGTATFIQDGAIAAPNDETYVEKMRVEYKIKRDLLVDAFKRIKLLDCTPRPNLSMAKSVPQE